MRPEAAGDQAAAHMPEGEGEAEMSGLDAEIILTELRSMRADSKADAEKLHTRINEMREDQIGIKNALAARPCMAHDQRMTAIENEVAQLKKDKIKAMFGWGIVAFIGAMAGPAAAAWVKTKLGM
jgi:hypothetical protein